MTKFLTFIIGLMLSLNVMAESGKPNSAANLPTSQVVVQATVPQEMFVDTPYTFFNGDDIEDWKSLSKFLKKPDIPQKIVILTNGTGGSSTVMTEVFNAIKEASKTREVVVRAIGPSMSAHAFIACAADKVEIEEGASLMFHYVQSYGSRDFLYHAIPVMREADVEDKLMADSILKQCVAKHIFTSIDAARIKSGERLYITSTHKFYTAETNISKIRETVNLMIWSDIIGIFVFIIVTAVVTFIIRRVK